MKTKTIKYGLRYKKDGTLLKVEATSNSDADFCVSVAYTLVTWNGNPVWLVESPEHAEFVRLHSTPWFNAGYEAPINNLDASELEVVKVTTEVEEEEVCVSIPTFEEMMRYKYLRDGHKYYEPLHYRHVMNEFKKSEGTKREEEFHYSLFDLGEYLKDKEKETKLGLETLKKMIDTSETINDKA